MKLNLLAVLAEMYKLCHSKDALLRAAKFFLNNLHMEKIRNVADTLCVYSYTYWSYSSLIFLAFLDSSSLLGGWGHEISSII